MQRFKRMNLESPSDSDRLRAVVSKASNALMSGQNMLLVCQDAASRDLVVRSIVRALMNRRVEVQANQKVVTAQSGRGEARATVATIEDAKELAGGLETPIKTVVDTGAGQAIVGAWLEAL